MHTRQDVHQWFLDLLLPLQTTSSPGQAHRTLGHFSAHYSDRVAGLEGFARPLWGMAAAQRGRLAVPMWQETFEGLKNGSNPEHPEFWGEARNFDQCLVEMAAVGFMLALHPEEVKTQLSDRELENLIGWLCNMYTCQTVDNNWLFFRVMVDLGLQNLGHFEAARAERLSQTWRRIEDFEAGGGWYRDGPTSRADHYIPMAFHLYSLIYAALKPEDPHTETLLARASLFAQDFLKWFGRDGSAVPYGRSLTYRFAHGAFWGALAFANLEALPWGVIKGLYLRHLRDWKKHPIQSHSGLLTLGYRYEQHALNEQYNSPSSPYWAFKAFLPLALPDTHPFWQAEEQPYPDWQGNAVQKVPGLLIHRNPQQDHTVFYPSTQQDPWVRHGPEKYQKFAYSNRYGFSVPSARAGLDALALDSMLGFSMDGEAFEVRESTLSCDITEKHLFTRWSTRNGAKVETWIVPFEEGHVRVHHVDLPVPMTLAEGAFAFPAEGSQTVCSNSMASVQREGQKASIQDLSGDREARCIQAHPNTSVMHPRTLIPTLLGTFPAGKHWLVTLVQTCS